MSDLTCFRNIGQLIQVDADSLPGVDVLENCALVVKAGRVQRVVKDSEVKASQKFKEVIDVQGRAVIPGFVDCHTHLIYAGERKGEIVDRLAGKSYLEILEAGGGLLDTVRATRKATQASLFRSAKKRMQRMMTLGTTAFEIKSGYGLNDKTEMKMLKVGQRLRETLNVPVTLTYLGAHAKAPEMRHDDYLDHVITNLPKFRELADGVDIFCEKNVFSAGDLKRLFLQAKLLGFDLRAHVEELSHQGGCYEAAKLGALSCDHLEYAGPKDIQAMRAAGTVAVLMPGVTLFLGGEKHPLVHSMIDAGVTLALATDCNPGSCPTYNMQTVLYLATHMYRLVPGQALAAATFGGAKALGREKEFGGLKPGQRADFLILKTRDYVDLTYYFGENFVDATYSAGQRIKQMKEPVNF